MSYYYTDRSSFEFTVVSVKTTGQVLFAEADHKFVEYWGSVVAQPLKMIVGKAPFAGKPLATVQKSVDALQWKGPLKTEAEVKTCVALLRLHGLDSGTDIRVLPEPCQKDLAT